MPKVSSYPYRALAQHLGVDGSGNVGLAASLIDVIAPVATGNQTTDTNNILAAYAATPVGGCLAFPRGQYALADVIPLDKNIRIIGASVFENMTGEGLVDAPWTAPFLYGTVFVQNAPGKDAFVINGASVCVHLSQFGIMFADAIRFTNTGHGIHAQAPLVGGHGWHQLSVAKSEWDHVTVFGTDGNHYGFRAVNFALLDTTSCKAYGGGVAEFVQDDPTINGGNGQHRGLYGVVFVRGTAHAYSLVGAGSGSFGLLNLMQFDRPQANFEDFNSHYGTTAPTASQKLLSITNPNYVRDIVINAPDFEPDIPGVSNPVDTALGVYIRAEGGFMPVTPYLTEKPYNASVPPTVAVLAGAGTGATASVNPGGLDTDLSGTVVLTTGTGTPNGDMFRVTYGTTMLRAPKFVFIDVSFQLTGSGEQFSTHTEDATGFTVQSQGANPTASTGYQISWKVVQ